MTIEQYWKGFGKKYSYIARPRENRSHRDLGNFESDYWKDPVLPELLREFNNDKASRFLLH